MIEIVRSVIIGGVQGISEFLPISSSGHLVLIPFIFNWDYNGLSFDIALHFGTVIAILVYFWKDWLNIIKKTINPNCQIDNVEHDYPDNFFWKILVASIPAAVLGVFLDKYVETYLHSPLLIAFNLIFFGLVLWLVDKYSKSKMVVKNATYAQAFVVGCAQAIALMPGVSRSGITITASRYFGLNRKDAARFSFLLATPAMIGAFLISAKDIVGNDLNLVFILGVLSSTIFGFLAIKYLLKYLERGNFSVFVWYRVILAIVIITVYFVR